MRMLPARTYFVKTIFTEFVFGTGGRMKEANLRIYRGRQKLSAPPNVSFFQTLKKYWRWFANYLAHANQPQYL